MSTHFLYSLEKSRATSKGLARIVVIWIPVKSDISLICGVRMVIASLFKRLIFLPAAHIASASSTIFLSLFRACSTSAMVTLFFCMPFPMDKIV